MKKSLTLLVLATILGIVAVGCDPAPKDEPTTTPTASTETPKDKPVAKTAEPAPTKP